MRQTKTLAHMLVLLTLPLAACGGSNPPPTVPVAKPPAATKTAAPPDVSPVPDPEGLIVIGRVNKPEAILKTVGSWTKLPLPGGPELLASIDSSLAEVVDLSQPVDGAVVLVKGRREPKPVAAVAVTVKSFDEAKAKLAAHHRLSPGPNGQFKVEGIGKEARGEEDDDSEGCILAPSSVGGRLVCGEGEGLEKLTPWLARTAPKQTWASDVHVEVHPAPLREPVMELRAGLPRFARKLFGASPALGRLLDASVGDMVDFVDDTQKVTLDLKLGEAGAVADVRVDYAKANSMAAKLTTSRPDLAGSPPPSFWHLPVDTDTAFFGRGSDPKLMEHPRELVGNAIFETAGAAQMPESERQALKALVADRVMPIFSGGMVYGKGFDEAALVKAMAARKAAKRQDVAADDAATMAVGEQVVGWHLVQVSEPITKIGPMVKDWSNLWNRPAFAKWVKDASSNSKNLARIRVAPNPAGVALPKDTVHLELTFPRPDIESVEPSRPGDKPGNKPVKKVARKPVVFHVFAVPDAGSSWLAFGLDGKLVAQKVAASLSTAPDTNTLGKAQGYEALREGKLNGAWALSLRGLFVFTALDRQEQSPFGMLGALPNRGTTPIVTTLSAQGPSTGVAAGSAMASFKVSRPVIEDIVRFAMMSR